MEILTLKKKPNAQLKILTLKKPLTPIERPRRERRLAFIASMRRCSLAWRYHHPLCIGVSDFILKTYGGDYGLKLLRAVIREHVGHKEYIRKCAAGGNRFDLYGRVSGSITSLEREYAINEAKERNILINFTNNKSDYK